MVVFGSLPRTTNLVPGASPSPFEIGGLSISQAQRHHRRRDRGAAGRPRPVPGAHVARRADARGGRGLPHGAPARRAGQRRDRDGVRDQRPARRGRVAPARGADRERCRRRSGSTPVLVAFIATVLGGMGSLVGAVIGGFVLGALTVSLQVALPLEFRSYRDAIAYAIVIVVLVVRPQGLITTAIVAARDLRVDRGSPASGCAPPGAAPGRCCVRPWSPTARPQAVARRLGAHRLAHRRADGPHHARAAVLGRRSALTRSTARDRYARDQPDHRRGLYTFVAGRRRVLVGHIAFTAIGAYAGAIFTIPDDTRRSCSPTCRAVSPQRGARTAPRPRSSPAGSSRRRRGALPSRSCACGPHGGPRDVRGAPDRVRRRDNWEQVTHGTSGG